MICSRCPAYYPSHTPDGHERVGYCRMEPPKVFQRFMKAKNVVTGAEEDHVAYDSAYPPTSDSKWCVKGRILMEVTNTIPKSALTGYSQSAGRHEPLDSNGLDV